MILTRGFVRVSRASVIMDVSIACFLVLTVLGNFISTVVLIRYKKKKERRRTDRKLHVIVVCCAIEVTNIVGSIIVCSLWIAADKAETVSSDVLCKVLRFFVIFWITCVVCLYLVFAGDRCYAYKRPIVYRAYERRKETMAPYFITSGCIALAVITAIVSVVVTDAENLQKSIRYNTTSSIRCILPQPSEKRRGLVIFHLSLGFSAFSIMFVFFMVFLTQLIKDVTDPQSPRRTAFRGAGKPVSRFPRCSANICFMIMSLVSWTPFLIVHTLREFSLVSNSTPVFITFGMLFAPAVLGPLVRYLANNEYREVWNDTIKRWFQSLSSTLRAHSFRCISEQE